MQHFVLKNRCLCWFDYTSTLFYFLLFDYRDSFVHYTIFNMNSELICSKLYCFISCNLWFVFEYYLSNLWHYYVFDCLLDEYVILHTMRLFFMHLFYFLYFMLFVKCYAFKVQASKNIKCCCSWIKSYYFI